MIRTTAMLLVAHASLSATAHAQTTDPLADLAGPQWSVIGTSVGATGACKPGDALYTFQAKPAQVVVKECMGGSWKSSTETISTWSAGGKSGIAFGGAKYEVKALPATAPVCKGNANCVRLTTVPDGKTDATRTLYLTH